MLLVPASSGRATPLLHPATSTPLGMIRKGFLTYGATERRALSDTAMQQSSAPAYLRMMPRKAVIAFEPSKWV